MDDVASKPMLGSGLNYMISRLWSRTAFATILAGALSYATLRIIEWYRVEPVKSYAVPAPKLPAEKRFLEDHSIKTPGSTAIQCYAPATGQFLGYVNPATPEGIDRAVEKAQHAQNSWAQTNFSARRQVLRCLRAFIVEHQHDICRVACLDSGKTLIDAMLGEILTTVEKLTWTIKHGEKILRPSRRGTSLLMAYKQNTVMYEPLGVVAALVSWNYPFHNMFGPIISAIFAGNGIVVKVSENTAWSASYFSQIAKGALQVCGHDPQLIQVITCWPNTANHLTSHPGISHITFIGSRPIAKLVAASASKALIPVVAELGGKDAAIVLDSARSDLPRVIDILLRGTFQSAGQNCIGIERIIATPEVYDSLVGALASRIRNLRVGSILDASKGEQIDMGAMISEASFDRLERLIQSAVEDGARLLAGGSRLNHPIYHVGHYFQPTLLVDVTPDMAIANEECFAPICVLMRAQNAEDASRISNAANFGLGASVFGEHGPELDTVVKNLKTGMVAINDFGVYYVVQLPFGGAGASGYGRFGGQEGLWSVCNVKSICDDRWAWARIKTAIPKILSYPIPDTTRGFRFTQGLIEVGHGTGISAVLTGIKKMVV